MSFRTWCSHPYNRLVQDLYLTTQSCVWETGETLLGDRLLPRIRILTIPIPSLSFSDVFASLNAEIAGLGKDNVILTARRKWSPQSHPFWVGSSSTLLRAALVSPQERCSVTWRENKGDLQKLGEIPERYGLERYSPARNMEQGWRTGWVSFVFLNRGQTTLIQMGMET